MSRLRWDRAKPKKQVSLADEEGRTNDDAAARWLKWYSQRHPAPLPKRKPLHPQKQGDPPPWED